jgi:antitoxin MazE
MVMATKTDFPVVEQWGDSLAIRLPAEIIEALSLNVGDEVEIRVLHEREFDATLDQLTRQAIAQLRRVQRPLPPDFHFNREDANGR